ncbi:hypothetical protein GCM10010140_53500 [Streptosporangium pseudovulgare]|uniref:Uncharacterized protein n=1 Tax=Streptosporangium pseudovulgare TaxID=35765 RepID=A0ABQ2R8G5_9ACTN|nr:hypothetical protein GCM10010140_53500 [Streptosporangium pseudovulgare]
MLAVAGVLAAGPCVSVLLAAIDRLELAGILTGLVAGVLLRGDPAKAAVATLYGSVAAVMVGESVTDASDGGDFADAMAGWPGWPGWVIGAVLAYLVAAGGLPRTGARGVGPAVPAVVAAALTAALTAAVLACGQLVAAEALGWTLWERYHEWDGPGWYRDLTRAVWYPAAAVVAASVVAGRMPGGRGRFLALPSAAWLGCAVTAGPLQYLQALGAVDDPPVVALTASLAGAGIGAAAGAAALRHAGTRRGLLCFVLLFTAVEVMGGLPGSLADEALSMLIVSTVLAVVVAAWTARRDASTGSGVTAGVAGPLLIWSVYVTVGSRDYDHSTQYLPYWAACVAALLASIAAPPAAEAARLGRTGPEGRGTVRPPP